MKSDVVIVGGGISGLFCANYLSSINEKLKITIIEKEESIGGVLQLNCNDYDKSDMIYGKSVFEYINFLKSDIGKKENIKTITSSIVVSVKNKTLCYLNDKKGVEEIQGKVIIFSTGAVEKTQGVLTIPGFRPVGIQTAGSIQYELFKNYNDFEEYKNIIIYGLSPSSQAVIRAFKARGKKITLVIQDRNLCVGDICTLPDVLYDNNKIIDIGGKNKIESIKIAKYDNHDFLSNSEIVDLKCDLLVLGCGYLPFVSLLTSMKLKIDLKTGGPLFDKKDFSLSRKGIYASGDALYIHSSLQNIIDENVEICRNILKFIGYKHGFGFWNK